MAISYSKNALFRRVITITLIGTAVAVIPHSLATAEYRYAPTEYVPITDGASPDNRYIVAAHGGGPFGYDNFGLYLLDGATKRPLCRLPKFSRFLDTAPDAYFAKWRLGSASVDILYREERHRGVTRTYKIVNGRAQYVSGPTKIDELPQHSADYVYREPQQRLFKPIAGRFISKSARKPVEIDVIPPHTARVCLGGKTLWEGTYEQHQDSIILDDGSYLNAGEDSNLTQIRAGKAFPWLGPNSFEQYRKVAGEARLAAEDHRARVAGQAPSATASATSESETHAIIDVKGRYVLGGSAGSVWISPMQAAKSIKPGKKFRAFNLTSEVGTLNGGKLLKDDVCPEVRGIELTPELPDAVVGVDATWNVLPRVARNIDTNDASYIEAVRMWLRDAGMTEPRVKIIQLLRIDLDGDGASEVLITATNYFTMNGVPDTAPAGSYSIVLLRTASATGVRTQLVAGELHPNRSDDMPPNVYKVAAILDLNGDGKLEVVVQSEYFEGGSMSLFDCNSPLVRKVLSVDCGL